MNSQKDALPKPSKKLLKNNVNVEKVMLVKKSNQSIINECGFYVATVTKQYA